MNNYKFKTWSLAIRPNILTTKAYDSKQSIFLRIQKIVTKQIYFLYENNFCWEKN